MRIRSTLPSSSELEAVLIVRENADEVMKQLAGLTSILNYRLIPKPIKIIQDTYYDTSNRSLGRKSINLRTRETDGNVLISLKSSARLIWGGIKRKETEVPWSEPNLITTAKALNLRLPDSGKVATLRDEPREVLTRMGLQVVQDRQTCREARDVTPKLGLSQSVLAEMDIDRVTYDFDGKAFSFCEVEVESKAHDSSAMRNVARELLATFKPALQKWPHGKFVTGKAIEKLMREGDISGLLSGTTLTAATLDRLDQLIKSGRISSIQAM